MILTVAQKVAGAGLLALIDEPQLPVLVRKHNRGVEVDQVRVVGGVALRVADSVWVMADIAWRIFASNVLVVLREAFISQNALLTVAAITQCIGRRALGRVVERFIVTYQYCIECRAVRSLWA